MNTSDFRYVDYRQPHPKRAKEILLKYPQVRGLFGANKISVLWILGLVSIQWLMAFLLRDQSFLPILLASYFLGAFANHALYVQIHECCHNLVWDRPWVNKLMGIVCDFALFIPSAIGFRHYHLLHHQHLGEFDYDADLVSHAEGKMIGNSWWRKMLWMSFFFFSQGVLRPLRLKKVKFWNSWLVANLIIIVAVDLLIYWLWGGKAVLYIGLSTLWALGLHPLGGRWIQEHYLTHYPQETYSYYGPLNKLTFNMGFHNEHHDLMMVPWNNLPKLRTMAPEYYENLHSYSSWTLVLLNFIFSKKMSPFSRVVHPSVERKSPDKEEGMVFGGAVARNPHNRPFPAGS